MELPAQCSIKKVNDNRPSPLKLQPNLFQVTNSGDLRNRTYFSIFLSRMPKAEVAHGMVDPVAMDGGFVFFDKNAVAL